MSPEVFAAREKNGIYIPRERYLQEEAEKKVYLDFPIKPILDLLYKLNLVLFYIASSHLFQMTFVT